MSDFIIEKKSSEVEIEEALRKFYKINTDAIIAIFDRLEKVEKRLEEKK